MSDRPQRPTGHRLLAAPFLWGEWALEWFDYGLGRLAIFQVLDKLGRLAVVFAVAFYILEADDRKRNAHRAAWQVINTAHDKPGDGGRSEAMEFLCKERVSMAGLSAPDANLRGINLQAANLHRANLSGADLGGANLSAANLGDANLSDASLGRANLSDANLRQADLSGAKLQFGNLSGAWLTVANLGAVQLWAADLSHANLYRANLSGAQFMSTNLNGAAILEANSRNVVTLDPEAVKKAVFWRDACYDDGFRKKLGLETENPDCVVMWGEPEPSQP